MLVLTEKTSIFPKSNMFWILVFSCPKMTLITIFTRMTLLHRYANKFTNSAPLLGCWHYISPHLTTRMPTLKALSVRLKLKASWEEEVATVDIVHEVAIQKMSPF